MYTLMTDRDDNAAARLHAERPPAKAPWLKDVTTVPNETMTKARSTWEVMLLRDMKSLRREILILLEESLLRRPPKDDFDADT